MNVIYLVKKGAIHMISSNCQPAFFQKDNKGKDFRPSRRKH